MHSPPLFHSILKPHPSPHPIIPYFNPQFKPTHLYSNPNTLPPIPPLPHELPHPFLNYQYFPAKPPPIPFLSSTLTNHSHLKPQSHTPSPHFQIPISKAPLSNPSTSHPTAISAPTHRLFTPILLILQTPTQMR